MSQQQISEIQFVFMKIRETGFDGLLRISPEVFTDERGYFFESFNSKKSGLGGIGFTPVQDNESGSSKGVIRGLHYQLSPHAQAKLIRVVSGAIFDVAVDLRRGSPTFARWFGIILDDKMKEQLLVPRGFAHGFSVLSDYAVVHYKCDCFFEPDSERSINPFDSTLAIDWKTNIKHAILSNKDKHAPAFSDAEMNF